MLSTDDLACKFVLSSSFLVASVCNFVGILGKAFNSCLRIRGTSSGSTAPTLLVHCLQVQFKFQLFIVVLLNCSKSTKRIASYIFPSNRPSLNKGNPLKLCLVYATTFKVHISLEDRSRPSDIDPFAHGQLYTALSRVYVKPTQLFSYLL